MIELFELIASKPLEFLAGLGISTTTIYAMFRFLKTIITFITKKSTIAKELLNRENIANTIVAKLGGLDNFIDSIANKVIEKIITSNVITDLKTELEKIAQSSNCPIELKAYINTVLNQSGNEQLALLYEQTKNTLINALKITVEQTITNGETIENNANGSVTEHTVNEIIQTIEPIIEIKEVKKSKKEKVMNGDISYA